MASHLPDTVPITEHEIPRTRNISELPVAEILNLISEEDEGVALAVRRELGAVRRAVEGIVAQLQRGGRLLYVGCGTSGRLGVLDASECPPTFGVSPDVVQGIIAGGYEACHRAVEASEDDRAAGARDLAARNVTADDAVIGLAVSGRTPYTVGAVEYAGALGAFTGAITCVPGSEITRIVKIAIVPVVGPEVLTGSSRMKAGTAQKLVLNMLSTATMIRLGYVTGNRMSNMRPGNDKLRGRSVRIVTAETGVSEDAARAAIEAAGGDLPVALVMLKSGRPVEDARRAFATARGVVDQAVAILAAE
jgi:N-acetylmuramic acid 6-phosphate etherase